MPEAGSDLPSAAVAAHAAPLPELATSRRTDREIWRLAWPIIAAQMLVSSVGIADIGMVGRLGPDAVAAAGYAGQFLFLAHSILLAIGTACVALMARAIGATAAGDVPDEERSPGRALAATVVFAVGVASTIAAITIAFPRPLLELLAAPEAVIEVAIPYLRLTLGSAPLLAIATSLESGFRAIRDTRTPLVVAAAMAVVKLGLNDLLIFGHAGFPELGLVGAGIATLVAQVVGVVLFVAMIRTASREGRIPVALRDVTRCGRALVDLVRVAAPSVGERFILQTAVLAYFAVLSPYGAEAVAAYTIGVRILSFSWLPGIGFAAAASTLVGQALGASDARGATRVGWRATRLAILVAVVLGAAYLAAREPLGRLLTDDEGIRGELMPFMLVLALAQPFLGTYFTLGGALRGAGDTLTPLLAATLGNWAFRLPFAVLTARVLEADVIWVWSALLLDHVARSIWLSLAFRRGRWAERLGAAVR